MRKFICAALAAAMLFAGATIPAFAEYKTVRVHGSSEYVINNALTLNGSVMVPIRTLADALEMEVIWLGKIQAVVIWNDDVEVRARLDDRIACVNTTNTELTQAPTLINGSTYLPLRSIAEAVGASVVWNDGNIDVFTGNAKNTNAQTVSAAVNTQSTAGTSTKQESGKRFYAQRQAEWNFENNGNGYCWVCAYAMALTSALGREVTPPMVAAVNAKSGSGAYMQHNNIINEFGVSFVSALDESSPYFKSFDSWRGATYINKGSDAEAIAAIKAALDKNPQGVMVRYTVYPHTLFAVGYSGDTIYFHEPAYENGASMTFEQTCLKKYKISDLDYLQAISK